MLNYEFPPLGGGAANATYYLLREFSRASDIEIDLVTSSVDSFKLEVFSPNIRIHYLNIGKKGSLHYQSNKDLLTYSWKAYTYCKQLLKEQNYDLCHAFFGIPCGYIAYRLSKKHHLPYIVSLRGSDVPFYNQRFYWLDKLAFKRLSTKIWKNAARVVANSQGLKDLALHSSPDQSIEIIPNGVDADSFATRQTFMANGKLNLLFVGRLIPRKGVDYLVQAIQGLQDVRLTIVGDGPMLEELENAASDLDVHFTGPMDHEDLKAIYPQHDVFVLPSLNEGMSNTVLEAMAAGLPLIVTDTGGTGELVDGNGFVVPKSDSDAIRASIVKFLDNRITLPTKGRRSRELAMGMAWDKIAGMYGDIYKKILNNTY